MKVASLLIFAPLLVLVTWAAISDWRSRRIANWLVLSLALAGLIQSFTSLRTVTPLQSLAGLGLGLAVPFVLFAFGMIGAGDVKLLAAIGAWVGPLWIAAIILLAPIASVGVLAVMIACSKPGARMPRSIPYGVAIWAVTLGCVLWPVFGR